jgi:hypothetical protein
VCCAVQLQEADSRLLLVKQNCWYGHCRARSQMIWVDCAADDAACCSSANKCLSGVRTQEHSQVVLSLVHERAIRILHKHHTQHKRLKYGYEPRIRASCSLSCLCWHSIMVQGAHPNPNANSRSPSLLLELRGI